jgi:SAM-dependent methyltransferase
VLEIGCATGELIAAMPVRPGGRRVGIDISEANVRAAQARFPDVEFRCGDFRALTGSGFDVVLLSDVLEHVPDDAAFLRDAAALADTVLLNLPLEDNWLNGTGTTVRRCLRPPASLFARRRRGAGRARRARRAGEGARLGARDRRRAGLAAPAHEALWRARSAGRAEPAAAPSRPRAAVGLPPFGRRLFASNLFVAAVRAGVRGPGPRHVR